MLDVFCERIGHLYIVVDGLDECDNVENRKSIFDTFKDLVQKCDGYSRGKLRVLFLSRPMPEIDKTALSADVCKLGPEDNEKEIRHYCLQRAGELQKKFKLNQEEVIAVVEMTCQRADG